MKDASADVASVAEQVDELAVKPSGEVKENKHKTISKFNAFKHGRRARALPLLCNHCNYRPVNVGGGGQCNVYQKDAVCSLSKEFEKYWADYNTRNPDELKTINDVLIKRQLTKIFVSEQMSAWDGGVPDKVLDRQIHVYLELLKMQKDLVMPRVMASQTQIVDDSKTGEVRTLIQKLFMEGGKADEVNAEEEPEDQELTELKDEEDGKAD